MSAEYVRRYYNVDYKRGERVVVDGRHGVIVSFPGASIGVRFDGENFTSHCHPTWEFAREEDSPWAKTQTTIAQLHIRIACLRDDIAAVGVDAPFGSDVQEKMEKILAHDEIRGRASHE